MPGTVTKGDKSTPQYLKEPAFLSDGTGPQPSPLFLVILQNGTDVLLQKVARKMG